MDRGPLESTIRLLGRMTDSEHDFLLSTLQDSHPEVHCVHDDGKWHLLSHYTHVLGEQMLVNDLDYLIRRKALSLPCSHIRDELFANFLRYVYPLTPFLDIDDFYTRNMDGESMRPVDGSLLLTQAILYAGSQFTDLSTFQELGFDTRREACQHFRENVRVENPDPIIQCLGIDTNAFSNISACLVMSDWPYDTGEEETNHRYWIDQAVSLAFRMGLHKRNPDCRSESSRDKLQRRLWWSCYTKDRLSSFPHLERSRIMDTEYDIPPLKSQDFAEAIYHPKIRIVAEDFVDEYNALVQGSVQLARLCIVLGRVVETFPITASLLRKGRRGRVSRTSNSKKGVSPVSGAEVIQCKRALTVEDEKELKTLICIPCTSGRLQLIQSSFSRIICGVCLCVACNWPNDSNANITNHDYQQEKSVKKTPGRARAQSIVSLSRLLGELFRKDLLLYLPPQAAGFLNTAVRLHHPQGTTSSRHSIKAMQGLKTLIQAVKILGARYQRQLEGCDDALVGTVATGLTRARSEEHQSMHGFPEQTISPQWLTVATPTV
ncbi:hypothetical protein EDD37DRAFT_613324 [Exophiala viscosa]|uniref:uncharacterized protein n=1 Tax=Exophiala viscosa TaxID=2486360 RepID=UPI002191A641|nr:hypothetical protein EDD37DRAFT_613324 [Exophiala viscosa]